MSIDTADDLIRALRGSSLFTAEEMRAVAGELAPLGDDPAALMRHLVQVERLSLYQLRKVVHGKAAELFLGPYLILDKLGEGGMGKVYRARHGRGGPLVALKVVRSNLLSNPVIRGRYDREALAAKALVHPNVVRLLDAGEAGGKYYLAMEFVDGIDLARLVRTHGILPTAEACEYIRQAALGLQCAHDLGLVHRDIKPSNIVVSGERHLPGTTLAAVVQILDMGLVRTVGFEESPGGMDLTRDGTVVGTPEFMAPEQAKNSSTVDHRADLYSLGCTFYFLLTGRAPFSVGSPIEKLLKHQLDPPPPLQLERPDVSEELARVVAILMAKKPEERYQTALQLAKALEPLTRHTKRRVTLGAAADTNRAARRVTPTPAHGATPSSLGDSGDLTSDLASPTGTHMRRGTPDSPATAPEVGSTDSTPRPLDRPPAKPRRPAESSPRERDPEPQRRTPRRLRDRSPTPSTALVLAAGLGVLLIAGLIVTLVALAMIHGS